MVTSWKVTIGLVSHWPCIHVHTEGLGEGYEQPASAPVKGSLFFTDAVVVDW